MKYGFCTTDPKNDFSVESYLLIKEDIMDAIGVTKQKKIRINLIQISKE